MKSIEYCMNAIAFVKSSLSLTLTATNPAGKRFIDSLGNFTFSMAWRPKYGHLWMNSGINFFMVKTTNRITLFGFFMFSIKSHHLTAGVLKIWTSFLFSFLKSKCSNWNVAKFSGWISGKGKNYSKIVQTFFVSQWYVETFCCVFTIIEDENVCVCGRAVFHSDVEIWSN